MLGKASTRVRRLGRVFLLLPLVACLAACAPGTPDADSWRIDAQRALGDGTSALYAAELALREHEDDRVFDRYLQTVLLDAEEAVGKASATLASKQPPQPERKRYDTVTSELEEAAGLITTVRIGVVDRETDRYPALADQLDDEAAALAKLEDDLQHPSASAGG